MNSLYKIADLDLLEIELQSIEQLGTKEKFWFSHPTYNINCLFKFSRPNTGEHWSEIIAEKICCQIKIPHAEYELAYITHYGERRLGVFTKNIVPQNFEMVIGNQFLYQRLVNALNQSYPSPSQVCDRNFVKVKEHTVDAVLQSLASVEVLLEHQKLSEADLSSPDIFCGYLLLDALISNQDRHHENWAVLQDNNSRKHFLCPSYDHASSLGSNVCDKDKKDRLETRDKYRKVSWFVKKARSALYSRLDEKKPLKTVEAYFEAVNHNCSTDNIHEYWKEILISNLTHRDIEEIVNSLDVAVISDISKDFAIAMIKENRRRILEGDL